MRIPKEGPVFSSMESDVYAPARSGTAASVARGSGAGCCGTAPARRAGRRARRAASGPGGSGARARRPGSRTRDGVAALDEHEAGGGGAVCERHGAHGPASRAGAPPPGGRESDVRRWPSVDRPRAGRAAASSAGRTRLCRRRRTRQRAPENARFATVAKPRSSARSASSRCAMRSPLGSSGSFTPHAVAVDAAAAGPHEQRARPARRARRRARRARARARSRACSSRASWPIRSPSSPTDTRSACAPAARRLRAHDVRARGARRARG